MEPDDPDHDAIIADVPAAFKPMGFPVGDQYAVEVPSSSALKSFTQTGRHVSVEQQEHANKLLSIAGAQR